ncbi:hypothetical protein CK934_04340 [Chitinophaga sp. MD30]|nr:hypothetical protein CK934_04340 [Chitinophaga sp. MD30]
MLIGYKQDPVKADSLAAAYQIKKEDLGGDLWQLQLRSDSANLVRIEVILGWYGYPGLPAIAVKVGGRILSSRSGTLRVLMSDVARQVFLIR